MTMENKGYTLAVSHSGRKTRAEKVYLKPMALYVPEIAAQAVAELIDSLPASNDQQTDVALTVINNNNGVSVDKDFASLSALKEPVNAADAVKDLINIVRGYDSDEETNVCGW
ncbi:DUF1869 domain-containing protein [Metakosakonia massiliensis]|uniref:DUF1869 domain-containing protein n=1 Tax=Phytobacter massiliensis TaxID=1485952 RepID=A0A6N2YKP0_9ENTR